MNTKWKAALGWLGVSITVIFSGLWAYWGSFENFHEGWYSTSFWENVGMLLFQYLLFTIVFVLLALLTLKWKKVGLAIHILVGGFFVWFFSGAVFNVLWLLVILPFAMLGLLYYFGAPRPVKWARRLIIFIPLLIILAISVPEGIKVSRRIDDGNLGTRTVAGNSVTLSWAPRGPGWPDSGVSWEVAKIICKHLSADGMTVMEQEQNIWRLPTVDEAVRSMSLHGENCGGVWNPQAENATYQMTPDKESPLWDIHSKVIYYWTADTSIHNSAQAYIVVYHGGVFAKTKTGTMAYQSFRAVKDAG